jgi:hypothetical protein
MNPVNAILLRRDGLVFLEPQNSKASENTFDAFENEVLALGFTLSLNCEIRLAYQAPNHCLDNSRAIFPKTLGNCTFNASWHIGRKNPSNRACFVETRAAYTQSILAGIWCVVNVGMVAITVVAQFVIGMLMPATHS